MREMLKLVFSTICGAIKDAIESRSRWQKPSQEPGFFRYNRGVMIWKWPWGSAWCPDPPPLGMCCVWEWTTARDILGPGRARFQSGSGAGGKKYMCHGVDVLYGTEEKWMREKVAMGGYAGKRKEKARWGWVHKPERLLSQLVLRVRRMQGLMGSTDHGVFKRISLLSPQ